MKKTAVLVCSLYLQVLFGQMPQTWSSKNGHSFQGTFVRIENQRITLRGADGREVTVPLEALDSDSRVQAGKAESDAARNAPVFTHQNRHLRFSLYPNRTWLSVEFIAGTQVLNKEKYEVDMRIAEIRSQTDWYELKVKEVYGNIVKTRDEVTMRLLMENGVVLKFVVKLDDKDALTYEFEAELIQEGTPKIDFRTALSFPKLLSYNVDTERYAGALSAKGVTFKDLNRFFEGYEITLEKADGEKSKILYAEKQNEEFRGDAFTINNPGKKSLRFEGPKTAQGGELYIWFYEGAFPFDGFNILAHSRASENLSGGPFSIRLK